MQRVLVMGCSGAGKSTFACKLAERCGLPFVSIDRIYWLPGWVEPVGGAFTVAMTQEAEKAAWVIDGNYLSHGAADLRRARADTVCFFDFPRWVCMVGIIRRSAMSYGQVRPEMDPGCPEKFDPVFWRYVWTFQTQQRPRLLAYFKGLRPGQRLVTFTTRAQADDFLREAA
ncbi:MAG: isopentenyl transferase family protein [Alphaproteobacteria bacterium]